MTKRTRALIVLGIKLAVAAGLLWWLIGTDKLKKESFAPAWEHWPWLVACFGLLCVVPWLGALRWLLLLRCQGFETGFWRTFHLTLVGQFFNCVGVGYTGGDLVKAYYVARDQPRGRRAEAVYTVGFDRFVGLFGLLFLGCVSTLLGLSKVRSDPQLRTAAIAMAVIVVVVVVGFLFMFSKRFRESGTIGPKLEKIPGGKLFLRFYRSVKIYRNKPGVLAATAAISVLAHMNTIAVLWLLGKSLGMTGISVPEFTFCVAVGLAVSAIGPPLGLGFTQMSFAMLFERYWPESGEEFGSALATLLQGVMLTFNVAVGLPAFLLVRREMAQIRAEMREDEEAGLEDGPPPAAQSEADA